MFTWKYASNINNESHHHEKYSFSCALEKSKNTQNKVFIFLEIKIKCFWKNSNYIHLIWIWLHVFIPRNQYARKEGMCLNAQQLNTLNTIIMQLMSQVNNKKKVVNILNDVPNQFIFFEYFTLEKTIISCSNTL